MVSDPSRRAALELARASALLRTAFDLEPESSHMEALPFGVTARDGDRAWVVSMSDDLAVLGGILVWADRHGFAEIDVVVEHHAGVHARRAAALAPEMRVWLTEGEHVLRAEPAPIADQLRRPENAAYLEAILAEAGLEVLCEDGIVRGELAGLEVARIVDGADGPLLEAGVGRFDREAGALLHGGRPPAEAVADTVAQVAPHRRRGAAPHAVNRLARERWLRAELLADPSPVGVVDPAPVEPVPPRANLLEPTPAAMIGTDGDRRVLVVCSVGADLGLVPAVADLVGVHAPDEVRLVLPERDRLPHLDRLLARLPVPAKVISAEPPWADEVVDERDP